MLLTAPTALWAGLAGLLGLMIGSFLNVVVYRVPAGVSVVSPPSACPRCDTQIRNRHNVPVLGWLMLRGRCYDCRAPISVRYPLVEALTGTLFAITTAVLLHRHLGAAVPAFLYLVAVGVALALIDLDTMRLPNSIVLPSYPVVAALLLLAAALRHDWDALLRALIGGGALFAGYFALAFAYPAGMGFGDVKLAGLLGGALAFLSWPAFAVGSFAGFVLGGVGGVLVLASGRGGRKTAIPFGPFMIAGALLAVWAAPPLAHAYVQLLGG